MTTTRTTRAFAVATVVATALAASGCSIGRIPLDGTIDTESRTVTDFTAIDFSDAGDINVTVGPEASLTVTADTALLPRLRTRVSDGVLHIDGVEHLRADESSVSYDVTIPSLESLDLSGAGNVSITGIDGESFHVDLSGAGDVTLSGVAPHFSINLSGAGTIGARNLTATEVAVDLSGAGTVTVFASRTLSVDLSGAGDVWYYGSPVVSRTVTGAGSIGAGQ